MVAMILGDGYCFRIRGTVVALIRIVVVRTSGVGVGVVGIIGAGIGRR
jgi:hypothetical protein